MMSYIGLLAIVLCAAFLPGFCLTNIVFGRLRKEEIVAASFGMSLLILAASFFFIFLLKIPNAKFFTGAVLWLLLIASSGYTAFLFRRNRRPDGLKSFFMDRSFGFCIVIFLLYLLHIFLIECMLPCFAGGNWAWDWLHHYHVSLFFTGNSNFADIAFTRTPLFNLVQAFFLTLWDNAFGTDQVVSMVCNSVFLFAAYLLTVRLSHAAAGRVVLCFLFLSTWWIHQSCYTKPQMLAVYFGILSIYFYIRAADPDARISGHRRAYFFLFTLFAGLGYLTHPLIMFYWAGIFFDLLVLGRRFGDFKQRVRMAGFLLLAILLFAMPWFLYTIAQLGVKKMIATSPVFFFEPARSALDFMVSRFQKGIFSILSTPIPFMHPLNAKALALLYYNPLMGCMTLTGTAAMLMVFIRYLQRGRAATASQGTQRIQPRYLFGIPAAATLLFSTAMFLIFWLSGEIIISKEFVLFLCLLGLGLACGGFAIVCMAQGKEYEFEIDDTHRAIFAILGINFLIAVMAHPGIEIQGVLQNAMPLTALVAVIYFCKIIYDFKMVARILVFAGVVFEMFVGVWFVMVGLSRNAEYLSGNLNWKIKMDYHVIFISDTLSPQIHHFLPYCAIALESIGICLFACCFVRQAKDASRNPKIS